MKKIVKVIVAALCVTTVVLGMEAIPSHAASNLKINGTDIGYAAGQYFSETGKACKCHKKGICVPKRKGCTCKHVNGTAQCYAFALWCENKMFGYNDKSKPKNFKNIGSASKLSTSKLKKLINSAPIGSHIRTGGNAHSMILMSKNTKGFTVAQANGGNNKEYKKYSACRIGTATYTWKSYVNSSYGKRGIKFIKAPKKMPAKKVTKAPKVTSSKTKYATGDSAKITWNKVTNATNYTLKITRSGKTICNKTYTNTKVSSYTLKKLTAGTYKASVTASNSSSKMKKTGSCSFTAQPMVKTAPDVKRDKSSYLVGESATITWNKVANADTYKLKAYGPGNFSVSRTVPGGSGCIIKSLKHGRYTVSVTATNTKSKTSQKKDISFVVNYPSSQTHPKGSQVVSDGVYHIVSDLDPTKNLNIKSYSKENGANVQLWESTNDKRQAFQVTYLGNGYYQLINVNSGKSLDVQPNSFKSGLNVQQWNYAGTNNQQWVIRLTADGSFNIISRHNSMYLDVAGDKATNGANIQVNKSDGSKGQKWRFIADGRSTGKTISNGTYYIVSALDKTKNLNVKSTSKQNGANIQLWATQHDPKHKFKVTYLGNGYYKITNANSGKALDVKSSGVKSGSNVQQWSYTGADNQQWIVKSAGSGYYYIIAKNSGLYLDAANGKSSNGTNVQVYLGNRSKAQKWKFVK